LTLPLAQSSLVFASLPRPVGPRTFLFSPSGNKVSQRRLPPKHRERISQAFSFFSLAARNRFEASPPPGPPLRRQRTAPAVFFFFPPPLFLPRRQFHASFPFFTTSFQTRLFLPPLFSKVTIDGKSPSFFADFAPPTWISDPGISLSFPPPGKDRSAQGALLFRGFHFLSEKRVRPPFSFPPKRAKKKARPLSPRIASPRRKEGLSVSSSLVSNG